MSYRELIAEHEAIEAAATAVLQIVQGEVRRVDNVLSGLRVLARLLSHHLTGEDALIFETVLRASGGRHAETASRLAAELEQLTDAWASYLYRWNAETIPADWQRFAADSADMLGAIRERTTFETMVLYSLAVHLEVVAPE